MDFSFVVDTGSGYAPIVTRSMNGVENVFSWTFAPDCGGTRVSILVEYKVAVPLAGKIAEAMLTRYDEQQPRPS